MLPRYCEIVSQAVLAVIEDSTPLLEHNIIDMLIQIQRRMMRQVSMCEVYFVWVAMQHQCFKFQGHCCTPNTTTDDHCEKVVPHVKVVVNLCSYVLPNRHCGSWRYDNVLWWWGKEEWYPSLSPSGPCHYFGICILQLSSECRRHVGDMSATCAYVATFSPTLRVVATQKRPRHTQFMSITADKYKSAQTYELATLP